MGRGKKYQPEQVVNLLRADRPEIDRGVFRSLLLRALPEQFLPASKRLRAGSASRAFVGWKSFKQPIRLRKRHLTVP
jgi:hypothetical protein